MLKTQYAYWIERGRVDEYFCSRSETDAYLEVWRDPEQAESLFVDLIHRLDELMGGGTRDGPRCGSVLSDGVQGDERELQHQHCLGRKLQRVAVRASPLFIEGLMN